MSVTWSDGELREFDDLVCEVSSFNQTVRSTGRFKMNKFISQHGKEKCDAMWEHLELERAKAEG